MTKSSWLLLFVWMASSLCIGPVWGSEEEEVLEEEVTEALTEEATEEEMTMPWSPRVQKILEAQEHRFQEVDHFCPYMVDAVSIVLRYYIHFALFLVLCVSVYPIVTFNVSVTAKVIRGVWTFVGLLVLVIREWYVWGLRSDKGYFFLADTGVLIVEPGRRGSFTWLAYKDIHRASVACSTQGEYPPKKYLRLTDKGGNTRDYSHEQFPSVLLFQELCARLLQKVEDVKQAEALKAKRRRQNAARKRKAS